ncbi:MAG: hypothetical protein AAFX44_04845 [Pseudomonadota bacterium]
MKTSKLFYSAIMVSMYASYVSADISVEAKETAQAAAEAAVEKAATRDFAGLSFGVGVSLTFDTGSNARVDEASIVDGIVRIDEEDDKLARVMLESHYFLTPNRPLGPLPAGQWGWGPFVALQPGTDEVIEAIGLGLMIGLRRAKDSDVSWNVGVGYIVDPNVTVLGDGFIADQPPPGGETEVRLKTTSQQGAFLLFSFAF